jgi:hypothetical protein
MASFQLDLSFQIIPIAGTPPKPLLPVRNNDSDLAGENVKVERLPSICVRSSAITCVRVHEVIPNIVRLSFTTTLQQACSNSRFVQERVLDRDDG